MVRGRGDLTMTGQEFETKMRNGWGARIAASVLGGLLLAATVGTANMAIQLAEVAQSLRSVEYSMRQQDSRMHTMEQKLDIVRERVIRLEARQ